MQLQPPTPTIKLGTHGFGALPVEKQKEVIRWLVRIGHDPTAFPVVEILIKGNKVQIRHHIAGPFVNGQQMVESIPHPVNGVRVPREETAEYLTSDRFPLLELWQP